MSIIANNLLQGDEGYNISRSLRFRSSASAYLNRTPASAGNRKTWTWSGWVKRGALNSGELNYLFMAGASGNETVITFSSNDVAVGANDSLSFYHYSGGGFVWQKTTSQVFRDVSAWYHLVVVLDTDNATAEDRARIYVNGTRVTSWEKSTNPSSGYSSSRVNDTAEHDIGKANFTNRRFDGYITEVNFIDGQALTPSSFGETDPTTGVWKAKKYGGTYGTNGFYLDFKDNSSTAALGYDAAGSNDWTVNNISLTAGTTYDSMVDVPTMSALGSNYCTFNPIIANVGSVAWSDGNLKVSMTGSADRGNIGTMAVQTGKWYWELTVTAFHASADLTIGISRQTQGSNAWNSSVEFVRFNTANGWIYYGTQLAGTNTGTFALNDVLGIALDMTNNVIQIYQNNTLLTTLTGYIDLTVPHTLMVDPYYTGTSVALNCGQQGFKYTPPTGFVALNTFNLPEPSIKAGNKHFNAITWTGNASYPRSITGVGFQPDFVWAKSRGIAYYHQTYDAVRGTGTGGGVLYTNATDAVDDTYKLNSFDSDGFSFGSALSALNTNNDPVVAWNWKGGNGTSSNTAGSITSTVSANPTAGFSVVGWTGNGSVATIGHGLGVAPKMIIGKRRDGVSNWFVYHESLGNTKGMNLNTTDAASTNSGWWNNTSPTSSVFTMGSYETNSGSPFIAYCFAEVAGYSKFGSYTGNGSSDGTFVHLGFRPKFVMIKRVDAGDTTSWFMFDTTRATYNIVPVELYANSSSAEGSDNKIDILSNGIKIRSTSSTVNSSSINYIYMAFAENPFKYSLAR